MGINSISAQESVPQEPTSNDFVLTISVDETTLPQGEGFWVDVELKNISGKCFEITHSGFGLFDSGSVWHPFGDPEVDSPEPISRVFEINDIIRDNIRVGASLEPGTHELRINANFQLADNGKEIIVQSNSIILTVTKGIFELTISTEKTSLLQGENLIVDVELKNISGEGYEIIYNILFWPHIPGWRPIDSMGQHTSPNMPETQTSLLNANDVIRNLATSFEINDFGEIAVSQDENEPWFIDTIRLEPGTHELRFSAGFLLLDNESERRQRIVILSAPITFTVLPLSVPHLHTASTWAHTGITEAYHKGFIPADLQNHYQSTITRAEFCRMAVRWLEYATDKSIDEILSEKGLSRDPNAFTDTTDPDILAAFALGITNGVGNNRFAPDEPFTREQAAVMMMNTCKAIGAETGNHPPADFADMESASSWARDGISFVSANGIMRGTGFGNFSPKRMFSIQESILMFNNIKHDALPGR